MNSPKVSVIIPVYNTEEYVEAAVRSIMNQTLRQIEIIVINDGSTDNSLSIVEQLAAEDARIRAYTQPNAGQAAARNRGLEAATGTFIYFMDSDDLVVPDMLALCYEKCTAEKLDFVLFDAMSFGAPEAESRWFDYHRAGQFEDRVYSGSELLEQMLDNKRYRCSVCLNLINREVLERTNLRFQEGIIHEDELFTALLYLQAQRVGRIDREFFHRRLREESTMTSVFSTRNLRGYMAVFAGLKAFAANRSPEQKQLIHHLTAHMLNPVMVNAWQLPFTERWQMARTAIAEYSHSVRIRPLLTMLLKKPLKKRCR